MNGINERGNKHSHVGMDEGTNEETMERTNERTKLNTNARAYIKLAHPYAELTNEGKPLEQINACSFCT